MPDGRYLGTVGGIASSERTMPPVSVLDFPEQMSAYFPVVAHAPKHPSLTP
jgi:hypothetical protein